MTVQFTSTVAGPAERGEEFGARFATEVGATVAAYRRLFTRAVDFADLGARALDRIGDYAPDLAAEIRGIGGGAGLAASHIAAVNARTEILAVRDRVLGTYAPGECSAVVSLGGDEPFAVQTWDWYLDLADHWLEWTIPFPDGRQVVTVTEYGILGKIGVNGNGVGTLFNILHHDDDGAGMGVPVHIVSRRILDTATSVHSGLEIAASARTSASTSITLVAARKAGKAAVSIELWPGGVGHVPPTSDGILVHTNHFLSDPARRGDVGLAGSDTLARYEALSSYRGTDFLAMLADHGSGLCCHPDQAAADDARYATLATIRLDVATGRVSTHAGGPCTLSPKGLR